MDIETMQVTLTADAEQFSVEMDTATSKLSRLASEEKSLKTQEEYLQQAIARTAQQIEKYGMQCDKTRSQIENKKQKIEVATQKYGENSEQVAKLQEQLSKLEVRLQNQTARLQTAADKSTKLNVQLGEVRDRERNLATQVKSTNDTLNTQQKEFVETGNKGAAAGQQMQSAFLMLKGFILGYAGKTLYETLIGSNAEFEQSMTQFEVLLGSAEKADRLMNDMTNFAAKTPFEMGDLTQGAQTLLAFGTAEEDAIERMQQLGDLSQGMPDKFERITLAYGKMQAKGKVSLEELNMLTEAGVPILRQLAQQSGKTEEELFKAITVGKLNIDDINEAIKSLTSEGGQFFGMMEKQSQTFEGMMSTVKDNINITLRQMGTEAFETLKTELGEILTQINSMSESGELGELASNWAESIGTFVQIVIKAIEVLYNMRGAIAGAGAAWATFKMLSTIIPMVRTAGSVFRMLYDVIALGATKQQIANLIDGKTVLVKNSVTGAITIETAAKAKNMIATDGATYSQQAFNAALLANPYTWVAVGLGVLVTAVIGYNQAVDSARQKEKQARQEALQTGEAYQEQSKQLDKLTEQYMTLASQTNLDEQAKKQLKSIQEQLIETFGAEAEGLDLVNGKYEEQIGILNTMSQTQAKDTAKALFADYYQSKQSLDKYEIDDLNLLGTRLSSVEGYTSGMIGGTMQERLEIYGRIIDKAQELGDLTSREHKTITEVTQRYNDLKKQIEDCNQIISQYNNAQLQGNYSDEVQALKNAQIEYNNALKEQDNSKIQDAKQKVDAAAGSLKNAVAGNLELEKAANDAITSITHTSDAAEQKNRETAEKAEANIKEIADNMGILQSALSELKDSKTINIKTLDTLLEKYPDLIAYLDDEKSLHNELMKKVDEEKSKYIDALNEKAMSNETFANKVLANSQGLINALAQAYGVDKSNFQSIAQIKQEIDNLLIKTLGENWSQYYSSQTEALRAYVSQMNSFVGPLTQEQQQNMNQAQALLQTVDAVGKAAASYNPKTVSYGGGSGKGKSSSDGKSSADKTAKDTEKAEQERIKGVFENADRWRQMGWISEEQYWEEVTALRDRYYAKDTDDWWAWTLKIQKRNEDAHKQMLADIEQAHQDYLEESQDYIDKCNADGWGTDNEIDAYQRRGEKIRQYQQQLLENEQLTADERDALWAKANEKLYDNDQKLKQAYLNQRNGRIEHSEDWIAERNYYGDWDTYNDSEADAWERVRNANKRDLDDNIVGWDEYEDYDKQLDKNIREAKNKEFAAWEKSAEDYYKQREKYGDWERFGDDEISYAKRKLERLEEFYAQDAMSYQEYADKKLDYSMNLWDAVDAQTDSMINKGVEEYEKLKKELDSIEQQTKDMWDRDDRLTDISDTRSQMEEFKGAVTEAGQKKYKELQERLKQLQREEEMYQLQQRNNAILEEMDRRWEELERLKAERMGDLLDSTKHMEQWISALVEQMRTATESQKIIAQQITNNYTNNNNINQTNHISDKAALRAEIAFLTDASNYGG